ncbi:uncharacterized protein LOC136057459 [Cyrtonyx montezumae]|uniref:uncharacterized protein LOC136057459 n=1 Tax=Cyrtonyx montezumae TaxID=9017 RepID=UPI0032DAA2CB
MCYNGSDRKLLLSVPTVTIIESAFSSVPEHPTLHNSRVDSHNRNQGRFSKLNKGEGIPESQEGGPETQIQSSSVKDLIKNYEPHALTNESDKPSQKESRVDSPKRVQENFSKQSKGNADPEILERSITHIPEKLSQMENGVDSHKSIMESFSKGNVDAENLRKEIKTEFPRIKDVMKNFESTALTNESNKPPQKESRVDSPKRAQENFSKQSRDNADSSVLERGRALDTKTSRGLESVREETEKIPSEKPAVFHGQLTMTQHATPRMEELTKTQMSLQKISENVQALQRALENMHVSTKKDLEILRAHIEGMETKGSSGSRNHSLIFL